MVLYFAHRAIFTKVFIIYIQWNIEYIKMLFRRNKNFSSFGKPTLEKNRTSSSIFHLKICIYNSEIKVRFYLKLYIKFY